MNIQQIVEIIFQVAVIAIPILLPLLIQTYRKYVQNTTTDTQLAAIIRLSNTAIDFVEDLDKRGELEPMLQRLNLPPEVINASKGVQKLSLAGHWLEDELKRAGVEITNEKAQEWVAAEFRKRVGDVKMGATVAKYVQEGVKLVQDLDRQGLVELTPTTGRMAQLAGLAADWAVTQLDQEGVSVSREDILSRVRAEFLQSQQAQAVALQLPPGEQLVALAQQAIAFVEGRQPGNQLAELSSVQLAAAWVLTEVLKQGLNVSPDQIAESVKTALDQRRAVLPMS